MKFFEDEILNNPPPTTGGGSTLVAPLKISVLRNVTVEEIEPSLVEQAERIGCPAIVTFGDYDSLVQEANGSAPHLFSNGCDVVLIFTFLDNFSPKLANGFAALSEAEVVSEIDNCAKLFNLVAQGIRKQTDATILWVGFEPPAYPTLGIADAQSEFGQSAAIAKLNARLREAMQAVPSAYKIDIDAIAFKLGVNSFYDLRYWHLGKAPYSRATLKAVAGEVFKFIRADQGMARKCLVLDCDNTLWGGIVGEDGLEGIKLGTEFPGSPYREFQQQILELRARGVIIAIASKNNADDVWEVFDNHPDMLLKREHISASRVNWQDKATNIRELAIELNIGLNSMVFIDDSDFELNLVSSEIPEVAVVKAEVRRASENRWRLAGLGLFDIPGLTDEDRKRSEMYAQELKRKAESETITDIASYLESLKIELDIFSADGVSVSRIAQQTQKTNQFNLTTRRYSEADISKLVEKDSHSVLACRARDKYGDMGIIGTIILEREKGVAKLDTMLLSCRALGRGIEQRFIEEAIGYAKSKGVDRILGEYIPTAKNAQVEEFLDKCGFTHFSTEPDGTKCYRLETDQWIGEKTDHFAVVNVRHS